MQCEFLNILALLSFHLFIYPLCFLIVTDLLISEIIFNLKLTCQHLNRLDTSYYQTCNTLQRDILTSKDYGAIAAVDRNTLAVGYDGSPGIDLIDLSGQVLRNISESDLYHYNHVIFYSPKKIYFYLWRLIFSHFRHLLSRKCLNPLVLFLR